MMNNVNWIAVFVFGSGSVVLVIAGLLLWSRHMTNVVVLNWLEALFLSLVGVVIFSGWLGVVLASLGAFSVITLGAIEWVSAIGLLALYRPFGLLRFQPLTRYEWLLLILLVGSGLVYFRPHEYVLGSTDAGTYMNISATVARTGKFVVDDPWTRFLAESAPVTLRQQPAAWQTRYLQFVGYYLDDADPGRVIPQFLPFHPVLIAIGTALGGMWLGLLVTPLWGILGLAAVYFATRRWFDPPSALLATALLAVTSTTIYFARYPTTEPLTLLLIFSGLWAFQTLYDNPQSGVLWGVWGGAAWGAAFLTRIDLPVVLALLIVALIVVRVRRRWSHGWTAFTLVLGLLVLHMILDVLFINWPYFWNTYGAGLNVVMRLLPLLLVGTIGLILIGLTALIMRRRGIELFDVWRSVRARKVMRALFAAAIIGLSAYAYFIRPVIEPVSFFSTWPGNVQVPVLDAQNWVRVGWYLTPLGLFLATIGAAWIVWHEPLERLGLFLTVGLLTTIQYGYNLLNMPYHIYAMRRYVPVVIPILLIYAAYALMRLHRSRPRYVMRTCAAILTLALTAGLLYQARYVLPQRDFFGAVAQLDRLNARLRPNAIVLMSEPPTENMSDTFGVPLRFTYGHNIATIRTDDASVGPFLDRLLAYATEHDQPVQVLALNPLATAVRQSLELQPADEMTLRLSVLAPSFYEYPSVIQPAVFGFEIYDVLGKRSGGEQPRSFSVDIGTFDTMFIRSGFYPKDILPDGSSVRWTNDHAALDLPLSAQAPITLEVRAMTYRPKTLPVTDVVVYLDNREIGRFIPDESWHTYSFAAQPRPIDGFSRLEFKTTTFNPAELRLSDDDRNLGFLLGSVSIVKAP